MNAGIVSFGRLVVFSIASWGCCLAWGAADAADVTTSTGDPRGWKDAGLHGGQINAVAANPHEPGLLLAGSYYGDGLFRSVDSGKNWKPVEGFRNCLVYAISFDPRERKTVWVVSWMQVSKTVDGGSTWRHFDPARASGRVRNYYAIAVDPRENNVVYVGTSGIDGTTEGGTIYQSRDGGQTWRKLSLDADYSVCGLAVNPASSRELWAVTGPETAQGGSIYRSRDAGETWSRVETGLPAGWLWLVAIDPHSPQKVFAGGKNGLCVSRDGGETWTQLAPNWWCRGFAIAPGNSEKLYASWGDQDFSVSADGGTTWVSGKAGAQFLSLCADPHDSKVLFGGEVFAGVYRSGDSGGHWSLFTQGIRAAQVFDSVRLSDGTLLAASLSGLYRSEKEDVWERVLCSPALALVGSLGDASVIYAGVEAGVCTSTDCGRSWDFRDVPADDSFLVAALAVSPAAGETLYLGTLSYSGERGDLYVRTNQGQALRLLKTFDVPVNAVHVHPEKPRTLYVATGAFYAPGTPGGVYRSVDGGAHWRVLQSGKVVNTLAIDRNEPDVLYVGCGDSGGRYAGVSKSLDGGITWAEKSYGIPQGASIMKMGLDPEDHRVVYAATFDHGIYVSRDRGEYWTRLGLPDYWLYDVLTGPGLMPAAPRRDRAPRSVPPLVLYAGSGSGLLEYTGAGIGTISGLVHDAASGTTLHGATLATDSGGVALSLMGAYMMVVPAGLCTLRGSKEGYEPCVLPEVLVTSGVDRRTDVAMRPLGRLYFPHVACADRWDTSIAMVNTSTVHTVRGDLTGFTSRGAIVGAPLSLTLAPHASTVITVAWEFSDPSAVKYLLFEPDGPGVCGYATYSYEGKCRASVPAADRAVTGELCLAHTASGPSWWTGVALLNTLSAPRVLTIECDTGMTKTVVLAPREQKAFTIQNNFVGEGAAEVRSGTVRNADGVIGMEIFGSADQLSGILLTDETSARLIYPHLAMDEGWWTGIVCSNPSSRACTLTISPYGPDGTPAAEPLSFPLAGGTHGLRLISGLGLPRGSAWLQVEASHNVSGYELFGSVGGNKLAGLPARGTGASRGSFVKPAGEQWGEIALINTDAAAGVVTLTAYDARGVAVTATQCVLGAHEKKAYGVDGLFGEDLARLAVIEYSSDRELVGYHVSVSSDGASLDALPAL